MFLYNVALKQNPNSNKSWVWTRRRLIQSVEVRASIILVDTIEMIEAFDVLSKRFGSETCTHGVEEWIGVGFGVIHVLSSHRSTHILVGQECCEKYKSSAPAGSAEVQQHSHRH